MGQRDTGQAMSENLDLVRALADLGLAPEGDSRR
jgi:hypothetical protein